MWTSARNGTGRMRPRSTAIAIASAVAMAALAPSAAGAQELGDPARLSGAGPLGVRAAVEWDEQITTTAGGATGEQYHEALLQTFREELETRNVPLADDAETFVVCRVQTYYDQGLIAYAVRVEYHEPVGPNGAPAVVWQESWVGTTVVGGLHQMFSLGGQCAADFAEGWSAANPL